MTVVMICRAGLESPPNSDIADEALGRCAPSGLRSLMPVVRQKHWQPDLSHRPFWKGQAGRTGRHQLTRHVRTPIR
jgi:hypothetical protein